jgi:hypothetical protein
VQHHAKNVKKNQCHVITKSRALIFYVHLQAKENPAHANPIRLR